MILILKLKYSNFLTYFCHNSIEVQGGVLWCWGCVTHDVGWDIDVSDVVVERFTVIVAVVIVGVDVVCVVVVIKAVDVVEFVVVE